MKTGTDAVDVVKTATIVLYYSLVCSVYTSLQV